MDASRAFLAHHIQSHPSPAPKRGMGTSGGNADFEREELKGALVAAQESAIVQLLLEICLPTEEERKVGREIDHISHWSFLFFLPFIFKQSFYLR